MAISTLLVSTEQGHRSATRANSSQASEEEKKKEGGEETREKETEERKGGKGEEEGSLSRRDGRCADITDK